MSRDPRTMVRLVNAPPPTRQGPYGRAWDRSVFTLEAGDPNDWMATVSAWVIASPYFHPFWDAWNLYAISLKDIPGVRAARKDFSSAEWEIGIFSVEPETTIDLSNPKGTVRLLAEPDLVRQLPSVSGEWVRRLADNMVRLMVEEGKSPDSDMRRFWNYYIDQRLKEWMA